MFLPWSPFSCPVPPIDWSNFVILGNARCLGKARSGGYNQTVLISSHILTELAEVCDTVGILEKGRLLAVGTVDEIQHRGQAPRRDVEVRILENSAGLGTWLGERPGIDHLQVDGQVVRFTHGGNQEAEADLLRAMIEAGFRVGAFAARTRSLEDVFMQVTKGQVQ